MTRCCLTAANVKGGKRVNAGAFGDNIQGYLHATGYSQKNLADVLGLHPKVLSRKLRGSGDAELTQLEVKRIVKTLVFWRIITTRDEVLHLLEQAQLNRTSFTSEEWRTPPLDQLEIEPTVAVPSSVSSTLAQSLYHNLPTPITRLIGREWAVERLRQLLGRDEVRVVSLVGPGGSGKTRLALHLADEMLAAFPQGSWLVGLAGVTDPDLVPLSVIHTLGIPSSPGIGLLQNLIHYLRDKRLLLLLDNFERVLAATSFVSELLAHAPGLKVLVTSQVVPHLYGEREFSVPPLDVPNPNFGVETTELGQYAAIQLFLERARAVVPDFALTPENGGIIAQICARLDGLPLALELAAALVKLLSPAALLERVSGMRLNVLTRGAANLPRRQQTLRNTIEWSYHLLSPLEQQWLPRLGVFTGGWSLEAGEAMMRDLAAGTQGDAHTLEAVSPLDMFGQLLDKSLLVRQPDTFGRVRFTMLETIREYALERLAARDELGRLRDWHTGYYLDVAEAAEMGLHGPQQQVWLARLAAERDNFRTALQWSLQRARIGTTTGDLLALERYLLLAAALCPYWKWQGYAAEGRNWLEAALELPLEGMVDSAVLTARAKVLSGAAQLAQMHGVPAVLSSITAR
jgi:predicted ATPase